METEELINTTSDAVSVTVLVFLVFIHNCFTVIVLYPHATVTFNKILFAY